MPEIDHEIKISATPERVFAALSTLDGIKGWHTPTATGTGEVGTEWIFSFADHPQFGWEITASDDPGRVVWRCTRGVLLHHLRDHVETGDAAPAFE
jgi:uncharacterized protein YndB with AHSA1/START domain